jgi:hypothetical protein
LDTFYTGKPLPAAKHSFVTCQQNFGHAPKMGRVSEKVFEGTRDAIYFVGGMI